MNPLTALEALGFFSELEDYDEEKSETDFQSEVIARINTLDGFRAIRLKATSENGIGDNLVIRDSVAGLIEMKRPGEGRRPLQKRTAIKLKQWCGVETRVMTAGGAEIVDGPLKVHNNLGF